MAMRLIKFAPGEVYHIYNRGNEKQSLFRDKRDWARFLFLILHFQSPVKIQNVPRSITYYLKNGRYNLSSETLDKVVKDRIVALSAFALMPNHFHLLVEEVEEGGISQYMQRAMTAYAKYFNEKYKHSGHVFQGPFGATYIEDNTQLLHISAYIHKNPSELVKWRGKECMYPWSSYQDFVEENRWGPLLSRDIILGQFRNESEYNKFVKSSTAKDLSIRRNGS